MDTRSRSHASVSIVDLPTEVLVGIFGWIGDARCLCDLSLVCKTFHPIACDDSLWIPLGNPRWAPPPGGWKVAYVSWIRKAIDKHKEMKKTFKMPRSWESCFPAVTNSRRWDYLVRTISIGDSGVGKTSLMNRFADGIYEDHIYATIGDDFKIKGVQVDGYNVQVQAWDTAGQERFKKINSLHYKGKDGVLIVFDLTKRSSFENVTDWINEVNRCAPQILRLLVGNKVDFEDKRVIAKAEAEELAREYGMAYIETSAKTGENVDAAYEYIIKTILRGPTFGYAMPYIPKHIPSDEVLATFGVVNGKGEQRPKSQKDMKESSCILQ